MKTLLITDKSILAIHSPKVITLSTTHKKAYHPQTLEIQWKNQSWGKRKNKKWKNTHQRDFPNLVPLGNFCEGRERNLEIYSVKNNIVNHKSGNWRIWISKEWNDFDGERRVENWKNAKLMVRVKECVRLFIVSWI